MTSPISDTVLDRALQRLNDELATLNASPLGLVVCGGAALIATGLHMRTTLDVDIVALADERQNLFAPSPLPEALCRAARNVEQAMGLPEEWLNNGPSRDHGGLFQMGLPHGLRERLLTRAYGEHLTVHFIGRLDQIHFKLYAAVDRGGYHIGDLEALHPTDDELVAAAQWAMTHDVSDGFRQLLIKLLEALGHEDAARRL
jgi:hypothetical protein